MNSRRQQTGGCVGGRPGASGHRLAIPIAMLVLLCLHAAGCVYYNTFYNARLMFREAERRREEALEDPGNNRLESAFRSHYFGAITKASIVLDLHPKSKWVDDSLLLIGKSYYWREEYGEALTKFRELQANYPGSELIEEAVYWEGLSLRESGRLDDAREVLREFGGVTGSRFSDPARIALAELESEAGNDLAAIEAYSAYLGEDRGGKLKARAWMGLGEAYLRLERYDEALDALRRVLSSKPAAIQSFEARIQIGEALEMQGKQTEALAAYARILKHRGLRRYEPQVRLKEAGVHEQLGNLEQAVSLYELVVEQFPRTAQSAEAYYRLGLIQQKHNHDLEQAREFFDKARREKADSEAGLLARKRQDDLRSLERYRKAAAKGGERGVEALFDLAEIFLFRFGEVDSAMAAYQRVLVAGDTTAHAPKALFALGVVYADSLRDTTAANGIFRRLTRDYAQTPYARSAAERIQHRRADDALAEARFLEAEALRHEGAAAEEVLTILGQLVDEYPQSAYAPKALFALAWARENDQNDLDAAREHYEALARRYPKTRFAEVAQEKLEGGYLDPPAPAAPDSSEQEPEADPAQLRAPEREAASPDSPKPAAPPPPRPSRPGRGALARDEALESGEVDQPPRVVSRAEPEYPPEAMDVGVAGTVVLRVLVGKDGRVVEVEVVTGNALLHDAASEAAYGYTFTPGQNEGKPAYVWTEVTIPFIPPD